jgi:hypothetical protein
MVGVGHARRYRDDQTFGAAATRAIKSEHERRKLLTGACARGTVA